MPSRIVTGSVAAGFALIEVGLPLLEKAKPATKPQYVALNPPKQSDHPERENHTPVNPCVGLYAQTAAVTAAVEYWSFGTESYGTQSRSIWRVVG
jgi:hypothetical protein